MSFTARRAQVLALAGVVVALGGCVRQTAPIISTTSIGSYEWPVGLASGTSTATYIFGFGPIGDDTVGAAIVRAIGKDGDALINTAVDRRTTYIPAPFLPIVTRVETRVFGTVIVYIDEDGNEILGPDQEKKAEETSLRSELPAPAPTAAMIPPARHAMAPPPELPKPIVWVRDGLKNDDFVAYFQNLRMGAVIEMRLASGRSVRGNFGGFDEGSGLVRVGTGLFGTRKIALGDIAELHSQTIRGEAVRLRRETE